MTDTQFELIYCKVSQIKIDKDNPNIRGRIKDTTDIQPSIKREGVQEPLGVRIDEDGTIYLIDGARRLTAAKRVGVKIVPCIVKDVPQEDVYKLMLISDLKQPLPHLILKNGHVVGGKCLAVKREIVRGLKKFELAEVMGIRPDIVGAYVSLYDDAPFVKVRVEKGDLDITVYSLMKRMPLKFKQYICDKQAGRITADFVRRSKKNWANIEEYQDNLAEKEASDDLDDLYENEPAEEPGLEVEEEFLVARCLNEARGWLRKIDGRTLGPTDYHILKELKSDLEGIE